MWSDHTCMPCLTDTRRPCRAEELAHAYSLKTSTPKAAARRSRPVSGHGSAPNKPMRQLGVLAEVDAALQRLLREVQAVGRRGADGGDAEVDDQVDEQLLAAMPAGTTPMPACCAPYCRPMLVAGRSRTCSAAGRRGADRSSTWSARCARTRGPCRGATPRWAWFAGGPDVLWTSMMLSRPQVRSLSG